MSANVLFIYPNQRSESLVPPAIAIFSSLLKNKGHNVELFDTSDYDLDADEYISFKNSQKNSVAVNNLLVRPYESKRDSLIKHRSASKDLESKVLEFKPDLVAVTSTESTFNLATQLLKSISGYNIPVILGGVFATFAPEVAIKDEEIDIVCVGEGENAIVDLVDRIDSGESYHDVTNLWVKTDKGIVKNGIINPVNVDELPLPDLSIFDDSRFYRPMYGKMYRMMPMETHRGCPYKCSFCNSPSQNVLYNTKTSGKFFRKRSVDLVRQDLNYLKNEMNVEYVYFWADTFFAWSPKEFDEFCEMYEDFKLPFWCQTRVETVTHERIKKLKNIGLHMLAFGMEHGNEKFRADVIDRKYSNQSAIEALQIPHEYGVPFTVNNIIGFPGETRELAFDTVEINRNWDADQMSCSILQPYYGTPLRDFAVKNKFLDDQAICPANSDDTMLKLPNFSAEEMRGLRRTFAMYVKFPKNRWKDIEKAERFDDEGNKVWNELRQEYLDRFLNNPETAITEQGNSKKIENGEKNSSGMGPSTGIGI
jgi:anaerobic magnesium-protoporphyrin IX monomethyl ester cyclase